MAFLVHIVAIALSVTLASDSGALKGGEGGNDLPPFPQIQLAPVPGFDSSESYKSASDHRAEQWVEKGLAAQDLRRRIDYLLAAANDLLACHLEPACSRKLLGLDLPDLQSTATTTRVANILQQARSALDEWAASAEDADEVRKCRHRVEALAAFGDGINAFLADDEKKADPRGAASALSVLLEDDNERVSAAAALWQAVLHARAGGPSRGIAVLDSALSEPKRRTLPYSFFARLLRCRLLADQGEFAAALALLMQIENQCDVWMPKRENRDNARRAVGIVRLDILRDWHRHLEGNDRSVERNWCARSMSALKAERFVPERQHVYRLIEAVPIIAPPPLNATPDSEGP